MPNEFTLEPQLDTSFPTEVALWVDPETGISIPKDPTKNLQWRANLLAEAKNDEAFQRELYTACSKSVLFFLNAFGFTHVLFDVDSDTGKKKQPKYPHVPFVTWEIQDKHIKAIEHAIDDGHELLTDKSRDMGATWNHIAVYVHRLIFRADESHLLISRKEDAVDLLEGKPSNYPFGALGGPGTLFGKIDYMVSRLPRWMIPNISRKKLHLVNHDNNTRIDGESANSTAGSSDRRTSMFLDEMAKMLEAKSIKRSTRDVTACRLPCSTPNGAGTTYSEWRLSGTIKVFVLAWWEHPEKGLGRYTVQDELGRWKIRSPWYNIEEEARTPKELAIEVDMDHVGSGDTFFEGMIIEEHRKLFACSPRRTIQINFNRNVPDADIPGIIQKRTTTKVVIMPKGPWKIWGALSRGRLDQTRTYTLGVDISKGVGASNSTVSVMCNETREKVMSFANANIPPYEFAKVVCAACVWVGGKTPPLLVWENNGDPGLDFGRQVVKVYQYGNIYFDRAVGTVAEKRGKRYGWRSSQEQKAVALGMLRAAYAHGEFINHDEDALNECLMYISFDSGGIGPADLLDESAVARKAHGDRVIGDMLCIVGSEGMPKAKHKAKSPPDRSIGHRIQNHRNKKKANKTGKRFDFSKGN